MGALFVSVVVIGALIAAISVLRELPWRWPSSPLQHWNWIVGAFSGLALALTVGQFLGRRAPPAQMSFPDDDTLSKSIERAPTQGSTVHRNDPSREYISETFLVAPRDPIKAVYGGFGIILLTDRSSLKSKAVCRAMLDHYGGYPLRAIRKQDGVVYYVRPVFWPVTQAITLDATKIPGCSELLRVYDLTRSRALMSRLDIAGKGPFLAVAEFDDSGRAISLGWWDLEKIPEDEVGQETNTFFYYYRDGVWSYDKTEDADLRQRLKSSLINFSRPLSELFGVKPAGVEN